MVNPEIINERLREMEENITLLKDLKSTPLDKFRDDPKIFKLAERCLQISIQCLLDICHHIYKHLQNIEDFHNFQKYIITYIKQI